MPDGAAQVAATSTFPHTAHGAGRFGELPNAEIKGVHNKTLLRLGKHGLSWTELFRKK